MGRYKQPLTTESQMSQRATENNNDGGDSSELNALTGAILAAGFKVHRALGPGLLESTYETCLLYELRNRNLKVERQILLPLVYGNVVLPGAYRIDLLVEHTVIVEVKAIESILPVHHAQLLTYLRLSGKPVGLLLNFNVPRLTDGIKRMINTTSSTLNNSEAGARSGGNLTAFTDSPHEKH